MKKKFPIILLLLISIVIETTLAQQPIAIGDFKNDSEVFYLDSWEKSIPEFLKSELSKAEELIVVERQQLESVLREQALSMTGLIDSATAQSVGQMVGAQYMISGKISKTGKWIRIDARIIQVSTGQVKSEKVRGQDNQHLPSRPGSHEFHPDNYLIPLGYNERKPNLSAVCLQQSCF